MQNLTLFSSGHHTNTLLRDFTSGDYAVQSNQHLIVHGETGVLLDPGGHKIYTQVLSETLAVLGRARLKHLILSHADPDVVAAVNGWLMTTDARAHAPDVWLRFIPHFGLDHLVGERLVGVPDGGERLDLGGAELWLIPAHWLHACGNVQVYDPTAKILYTGDLGASIGSDYREVKDFGAHVPKMEGFHRRYMASRRALEAWSEMARTLDIETIAPQHGALFRGADIVQEFIEWCSKLECGMDIMTTNFVIPKQTNA